MPCLNEVVSHSIIICYKENVDVLLNELKFQGLSPRVQRAFYTEEELQYSLMSRCFLNHRDAWERVLGMEGHVMICESDFVPCKGLGGLPVFWPDHPMAWGYLYQGAPRLLTIEEGNYLRCQAAPVVAYILSSSVARILIDFFDDETSKYELRDYYPWDSNLQWYAMGRGARAYMPLRHYGEHGGAPNPEHSAAGVFTRGGVHRADNLAAPLAFLPPYAGGSRRAYLKERVLYRGLGWARLATGRWIQPTGTFHLSASDKARMTALGVRRLLPRVKGL